MITATLDSIGRETNQGDLVAYIKIYKDGVLVENACVKYNPANETHFRDEIGKRIMSAENSIEATKALVASALAEVVSEKNIEIEKTKETK